MTAKTKWVLPWLEEITIFCDCINSNGPIKYIDGFTGDPITTPYSCADAQCDPRRALALVLEYLGPEYYAIPGTEDLDAALRDAITESEIDTSEDTV